MLDIKLVKENPQIVISNLKKRHKEDRIPLVSKVVKLYEEWTDLKKESDELRHRRNEVSLEINKRKKANEDVSKQLQETKEIPKRIKEIEIKQEELQHEIKKILPKLPNIAHESVPLGKDESENVELRKWGPLKSFDFKPKSHVELIENLNIGDFERAAKISGNGFYILKGDLARLNNALIKYGIDFMVKRGYAYVEPPLMIKKKPYEGVVDMQDFIDVMYKVENEDLYMIATSEHPLISMFMDESVSEDKLPIKITGYSMCFRKEVGAHGIDTKGIFRTHQFNKVEQIILCKPEDSYQYYEELLKNSEDFYKTLEIPYRIVESCTGDLGVLKSKSADIEAWFPKQEKYQEVGSCSNITDFQARRLNIKCINSKGERRVLHTLNNTLVATSRALVAILENNQQRDGFILVPKVLHQYLDGLTVIKKQNLSF